MTEAEWQDCSSPYAMIGFLNKHGKDGTMQGVDQTSRKWRLLYCGCCRQVWHLLVDSSRRAVEAAERFADGIIKKKTLREHYLQANRVLQRVESDDVTPLIEVYAAALAMGATDSRPGGVCWNDDEVRKLQEAYEAPRHLWQSLPSRDHRSHLAFMEQRHHGSPGAGHLR